jgi:ankyrin repeat protein
MKILFTLFAIHSFLWVSAQKILDDIKSGNTEKVQKWLEKADQITETFTKSDETNTTTINLNVIEWAAFHNQTEIIELFIQNKDKFPNFGQWINPALGASTHNCNLELFKLLVEEGAKLDYRCQMCNDAPPVAIALSYNCDEIFSYLKSQNVEKEGLDINQKGKEGLTPLLSAADKGKIDNIKYLLSKGALLTEKDSEGRTALHFAMNLETFVFLEEKMIKSGLMTIEMVDKEGPLFMYVIELDNKELFDYLMIHYKSLLKSKDKDKNHVAMSLLNTSENTVYFFQQLKKNKFNFDSKNNQGKDLAFYAKKMGKKDLLELLNK